jgi:hypothetical protein
MTYKVQKIMCRFPDECSQRLIRQVCPPYSPYLGGIMIMMMLLMLLVNLD